MEAHFEKMILIFNTLIEQWSQGKRPPASVKDTDVRDIAWHQQKESKGSN